MSRLATCLSLLLTLFASTATAAQTSSAADLAALYGSETSYSIFRKGKKIGEHRLQFSVDGAGVTVSVESTLTVRVLKVPVFKFKYLSDEVWENGALIAVKSSAKANSNLETASLVNNENTSILNYNGKTTNSTQLLSHASNHWNINAVFENAIFNTIKGEVSQVSVTKSSDTVEVGNTAVAASRYDYTGDLTVSAWYDKDNRWIKLMFAGNDGSEVTYMIDKLVQ